MALLIQDEPLTAQGAAQVLQIMQTFRPAGTDAAAFVALCLSVDRIARGVDTVAPALTEDTPAPEAPAP